MVMVTEKNAIILSLILKRTVILVRTLMDDHFSEVVGWTLGGHWVDAQPTFEDAEENWSRDCHGHASELQERLYHIKNRPYFNEPYRTKIYK